MEATLDHCKVLKVLVGILWRIHSSVDDDWLVVDQSHG